LFTHVPTDLSLSLLSISLGLLHISQAVTVLGIFSLLLRMLWLLDTIPFQFQCPESAAKWILKVLSVPDIPMHDAEAF
jgi:hypothetical protein